MLRKQHNLSLASQPAQGQLWITQPQIVIRAGTCTARSFSDFFSETIPGQWDYFVGGAGRVLRCSGFGNAVRNRNAIQVPGCSRAGTIVAVWWALLLTCVGVLTSPNCLAKDADKIINLWPGTPPGPSREVGEEQDMSKPGERPVAGRPVIRLGNVSVPQAHVYLAPPENRSGAAIVICPGGGYNILAWNLEGTEVAEWANSMGVTAIVVKYRVPTAKLTPKWLAPVQDAQRAISLTRSQAAEWMINPERIAVLGFSAGGDTAARTALATERQYKAVDAADEASCRANAGILIYPAYLTNAERTGLGEDVVVTKEAPPMFMTHAFDDRVTPESSLYLALAMKKQNIPVELHLYDAGGHGYGLRPVEELPITGWNHRCADWLKRNGWTK